MPKCTKTVTGKHMWYEECYENSTIVIWIKCRACGMIDDRKKK